MPYGALALINEASGGNTSFFTISALRCMGEYIVGNHIDLDYFNCPGDCPAHLRLDAGPGIQMRRADLLG